MSSHKSAVAGCAADSDGLLLPLKNCRMRSRRRGRSAPVSRSRPSMVCVSTLDALAPFSVWRRPKRDPLRFASGCGVLAVLSAEGSRAGGMAAPAREPRLQQHVQRILASAHPRHHATDRRADHCVVQVQNGTPLSLRWREEARETAGWSEACAKRMRPWLAGGLIACLPGPFTLFIVACTGTRMLNDSSKDGDAAGIVQRLQPAHLACRRPDSGARAFAWLITSHAQNGARVHRRIQVQGFCLCSNQSAAAAHRAARIVADVARRGLQDAALVRVLARAALAERGEALHRTERACAGGPRAGGVALWRQRRRRRREATWVAGVAGRDADGRERGLNGHGVVHMLLVHSVRLRERVAVGAEFGEGRARSGVEAQAAALRAQAERSRAAGISAMARLQTVEENYCIGGDRTAKQCSARHWRLNRSPQGALHQQALPQRSAPSGRCLEQRTDRTKLRTALTHTAT